MPAGFDENDKKTRDKCVYLKQLLADKRTMAQMPGAFTHLDRLLDDGKYSCKKIKKVIFTKKGFLLCRTGGFLSFNSSKELFKRKEGFR